jgi:hypothetical protein
MKDDTALLRDALYVIEAWENNGDRGDYYRDRREIITDIRHRLNLCPDCGSDTRLSRGWVSNIETFWRSCEECEWRGEPE